MQGAERSDVKQRRSRSRSRSNNNNSNRHRLTVGTAVEAPVPYPWTTNCPRARLVNVAAATVARAVPALHGRCFPQSTPRLPQTPSAPLPLAPHLPRHRTAHQAGVHPAAARQTPLFASQPSHRRGHPSQLPTTLQLPLPPHHTTAPAAPTVSSATAVASGARPIGSTAPRGA